MSAAQMDLFGQLEPPARYPHAPGFKCAGTSQEAAEQMCSRIGRLQAEVLAELRRWPDGRTADEIARLLQRSILSIRPRLTELKKAGEIVPTGERRRNESGMFASVLRAA